MSVTAEEFITINSRILHNAAENLTELTRQFNQIKLRTTDPNIIIPQQLLLDQATEHVLELKQSFDYDCRELFYNRYFDTDTEQVTFIACSVPLTNADYDELLSRACDVNNAVIVDWVIANRYQSIE